MTLGGSRTIRYLPVLCLGILLIACQPATSAPTPTPSGGAAGVTRVATPAAAGPATPGTPATPTSGGPSAVPAEPRAGTATDDLGSIWHETEQEWTGVWTRRPGTSSFEANWTDAHGNEASAVLTISIQGNNVSVQRREDSHGNECDYQGVLSADKTTASGTYGCTVGTGPFAWRAEISR
jgi:hypothetical protein